MARVDFIPAEAAQLDPARERRLRRESRRREEEDPALRRPPRGGWPRMGRQKLPRHLLHDGGASEPGGGQAEEEGRMTGNGVVHAARSTPGRLHPVHSA